MKAPLGLVALVIATHATAQPSPGASPPRPRVWDAGRWERVVELKSAPGDERFAPYWVDADEQGFITVDLEQQAVVAFDWSGRLAWRHTGPGRRFRGLRGVRIGTDSRVRVIDNGTLRVVSFTRDGTFDRSISLVAVGGAERTLEGLHGGARVLSIADSNEICDVDASGRVLRRFSMVAPGYSGLDALARQVQIRALSPGRTAVAMSIGDRWFVVDSTFETAHSYPLVDQRSPPAVRKVSKKGESQAGLVGFNPCVSCGLTSLGDTVIVLAGGSREVRNDVLDYYSVARGEYLFSRRLPYPSNSVAASGNRTVVSTQGRAGVVVQVLRWRPSGAAAPLR